MNTMHNVVLSLGIGLTTGTVLLAQNHELVKPRQLESRGSLMSQSYGVVETGGQLRAVGPDYRAVIDGDGMTFTPALGSEAPRALPLRLEVVSVSRGDRVAYDRAAAGIAKPTRDGTRVSVARAPAMTERFDATVDGVELTWRFDRPIEGSGDLVVRYRVVTELENHEAAVGARYLRPGLGGVTIGGVTGIDARGERAVGAVRTDDELLELSLPAWFVDSAAYPLVLDPVVGSDVQIRIGTNDYLVDVSYDASSNRYLFVWQTVFASVDAEIRGQLTGVDGALIAPNNLLVVSPAGSTVAMRPRVANVDNTNRFLVVWQSGQSILGEFDIQCAAVNTAGTVSNAVFVASSATVDELEPDVANTRSTDNDALVVWRERGNGIRGAQVDVPASGDPVVVGSVQNISTDGTDESPAISDGGATRRVVTWIRPSSIFPLPTGTAQTVRARATTINLAPVGSEFLVSSSRSLDARNVAVDGDGTQFLVAWDYKEASNSDLRDVWCRALVYTSDLGAASPSVQGQANSANPNDHESDPAVALIGTDTQGLKYVMAWSDGGNGSSLDAVIGIATVAPLNCLACSPSSSEGGSTQVDFGPAIASRYQAGENADDCMIASNSSNDFPAFDPDVWAIRYEAFGAGGSTANLGGQCGIGGTTGTAGLPAVGNPNFEVRLTGAAGALGGVLILDFSPPINGTVNCGPCTVLVGIATQSPNSFDGVTGMATAALPIPCDARLIGGQLEAQWLTVNIGASPCAIVPNISASNRLRIVVGE